MDRILELKRRYFRQVIAHPDGAIVHHGDCEIYAIDQDGRRLGCNCGLHHDLQHFSEEEIHEHYPAYYDELARVGLKLGQEPQP